MKRLFIIFLMCFTALAMQAQPEQYVDLGLPSGTLWKSTNEKGGFYDYDSAKKLFGDKLPTKNQWEELMTFCIWTWTGKGYKITGKNGKSIVLPSTSPRGGGSYWSVTNDYPKTRAWIIEFSSRGVGLDVEGYSNKLSVRVVKE